MHDKELSRFIMSHRGTLRHAMETINDNWREVALVQDENQRIVGVVTDGDIRRGLLAGLGMDVGITDIMSRNFRHVGPHEGRAQVVDIMRALNIRQVPVMDDEGHLLSIHFLNDLIGAPVKRNVAVVMAGGKGTRLRPFTADCPKPMVKVAGRPILERIVLHLVGHGITNIFLSVNYLGEIIEEHFGTGENYGCSIKYLREDKPLGTGGSLSLLPSTPELPFVVMNGDQVTQADISKMLAFHERYAMEATIGIRPYSVDIPFGVVTTDGPRLAALIEKPVYTHMVSTGIYVLSPSVVSLIPQGVEFPITNLFHDLLSAGRAVGCHHIEEEWLDVGYPTDLYKANGVVR